MFTVAVEQKTALWALMPDDILERKSGDWTSAQIGDMRGVGVYEACVVSEPRILSQDPGVLVIYILLNEGDVREPQQICGCSVRVLARVDCQTDAGGQDYRG